LDPHSYETAVMRHVNCPMCDADDASELFRATDRLRLAEGSFPLVKCAHCGLVYLDPRPDEDELPGYYPKTYWGDSQKGIRESLRGLEERFKEGYKLRALSRAGLKGGRLLDVGCGRGEFLSLARAGGFDVSGLEPGAEAAARGRAESGLDITCGSVDNTDLPPSGFDAVTLWHVLEHLPDPLGALRKLHGALKPGGMIFLAVPDFGSWQSGAFRADWLGVDAPRHLTHFTRETLSAILVRAGFDAPVSYPAGARYETAMLVRSVSPGLNYRKLHALERGLPARYLYKAVQLALDLTFLPAGLALAFMGRGCAFTAVAGKKG
jgi:2-polyprenyl-3-methyl-5-hydroxy-6-metoxy-1,4-benzoquinol methylase